MSINSTIKRLIPGPVKKALTGLSGRQAKAGSLLENKYSARHRLITNEKKVALEKSIQSNYHTGWRSREKYTNEAYEKDLKDHLYRRLELDRNDLVPWLDSIKPLEKSNILEIGCGTGSSTVALAEQGATVIGIDIDEGALTVAIDRCKAYGIDADIRVMNATEIDTAFGTTTFDFIIFFACLEHMTIAERLDTLAKAWRMLPPGGMLGVIETPNRLWYYDSHTSLLPFFHWLPDELAFKYSRFSTRDNFHNLYREWNPANAEHFLRRGRGVSYHEVDLSIRPVQELAIESLSEFRFRKNGHSHNPAEAQYIAMLRKQCPAIPAPFFEKQLDIVLRKE